MLPSSLTGFEGAGQALSVQIAANEDKARLTFFILTPGALVVALDDHVHALHHETVGIVPERDDALEAQDARAVHLRGLLDPREKLLRIHFSGPK